MRRGEDSTKLVVVLAVVALLTAAVTSVWAAGRADGDGTEHAQRIVPVVPPVDLNPCAAGACW